MRRLKCLVIAALALSAGPTNAAPFDIVSSELFLQARSGFFTPDWEEIDIVVAGDPTEHAISSSVVGAVTGNAFMDWTIAPDQIDFSGGATIDVSSCGVPISFCDPGDSWIFFTLFVEVTQATDFLFTWGAVGGAGIEGVPVFALIDLLTPVVPTLLFGAEGREILGHSRQSTLAGTLAPGSYELIGGSRTGGPQFGQNWGFNLQFIPEPGTASLLGMGLLGMSFLRRQR